MKKDKNKVIIVLIVIFALIFAAVGGYIVFRIINSAFADNDYDKLASSYAPALTGTGEPATAQSGTQSLDKPENTAPTVKNPVDIPQLKAENPDIYSWINIPNTNVNA